MTTMTKEIETGAYTPLGAQSGKPLRLAMQELFLTGRILPVGARLLVRHTFRSAEAKLIEAVYCFPLPRDAALRRFEIQGDNFIVHSMLKPAKEAGEDYEKALGEGHLAGLARQYRDGLINLSLGNLRPDEIVTVTLEILCGVDLRDDGLRFRFPFTLAPSYHSMAKAAEIDEGEGEIELPEDRFGDVILPRFRRSAEHLHQISFDLGLEMPRCIDGISSPSHAIEVLGMNRVRLAPASDLPDRDLVLDVRALVRGPLTLSGTAGDGRRSFAVVLPSTEFGVPEESPRAVAFLLDRSGSMSGTTMRQARKAAAACLAALRAQDRFGLVAFDNACELFSDRLVTGTPENRRAAANFLEGIDARGGTELAAGIREAAKLLEGSGGDLFIITDGQVFATEDILETARAAGCRLHLLGIGSASQDRFLALLARETGGVSRFVTPRERVDRSALELFATVSRPVATDVKPAGTAPPDTVVSPDPAPDVYPGTPLLIFGDCAPQGRASVAIEFDSASGHLKREVDIPAADNACGETLRLLRGSRLITDAEARLGSDEGPRAKREAGRRLDYLARLSREYSLASRAMALVAVVERPSDRPGEPPQTHVVPVGLPQDMQFEGVFSTALPDPHQALRADRTMFFEEFLPVDALQLKEAPLDGPAPADFGSYEEESLSRAESIVYPDAAPAVTPSGGTFDGLVELSTRLEPDGGMPGKTDRDRIIASLIGLLAFLADGHDLRHGAFRMHVGRLIAFLDLTLPDGLLPEEVRAAGRVIEAVRAGKAIEGDWATAALDACKGATDALNRAWQELLGGEGSRGSA